MAFDYLRREPFEWKGVDRDGSHLSVSGVVRERIGSDIFRRDIIQITLPDDVAESYVGRQFADFVLLTEKVDGLPWWPDANTPRDKYPEILERWQVLPPALMTKWADAIYQATEPPEQKTAPVVATNDDTAEETEGVDPNG